MCAARATASCSEGAGQIFALAFEHNRNEVDSDRRTGNAKRASTGKPKKGERE